jgi:ferritin
MHKELNKQIAVELSAAYLYFSMAAYADSKSLNGIKSWLMHQAQEEMEHGMKIYRYLADLGLEYRPEALPQPESNFKSMEQVFERALKNEKDLGLKFNNLSEIAKSDNDNTTFFFLEWFLTEQVEEVATVSAVLDQIKMVKGDGTGMLLIDAELGKRGS